MAIASSTDDMQHCGNMSPTGLHTLNVVATEMVGTDEFLPGGRVLKKTVGNWVDGDRFFDR